MRDELRVEGMEAGDASLRSLRDLDLLKQGADACRWLVVACCLLPTVAGCYANHDASRTDAPMDSAGRDTGMDVRDMLSIDAPDVSEPDVARPDAWDPPRDTPPDACSAPSVPRPLGPENGTATGRDLRPRFRWLPTDPCSTYELEVDDSCATPGFAACDFPSPEVAARVDSTEHVPTIDLAVSETQPIGRRYYWRVRACSGAVCGAWSPVRYIDVGRTDGDFDGDGCADPAIATWVCPSEPPRAWWGCMHIHRGGASGEHVTLTSEAYESFYLAVALARDVNADGYGDLIVGASNAWGEWGPGRAFLYLGGPAGLSEATMLESPTGRAGSWFGHAVAGAGDLDADGYADVAVGAPREDDNGRGRAYVYLGGAGGLPALPNVDVRSPWGFAEERTEFGRHFAHVGDVDADGHADLAVSAAFGRVAMFPGGTGGIDTTPSQILTRSSDLADTFGFAVAGGDLDGDGFADVVVGATNPPGSVSIFGGSVGGVSTTPRAVLDPPDSSFGSETLFGAALAVADLDGDGIADVVAGAPRLNVGTLWEVGAVSLFRGGPSGPAPWAVIPSPTGASTGRFGQALTALDYSCDGHPDLIVGLPGEGVDGIDDEGIALIVDVAGAAPPILLESPVEYPTAGFGYLIAGH